MSDDARQVGGPEQEPDFDIPPSRHVSMDTASDPTPEATRSKLLEELAAVDPADAPNVADTLADILSNDLDGPVGGAKADSTIRSEGGLPGEAPG